MFQGVADIRPAGPSSLPVVCPFHTLPAEILLEIISSVPFTPANFLSLRLACRRFHDVLTQHEGPIAAATRKKTFDLQTTMLFPGLDANTLRNLGRLHARTLTLGEMHAQWPHITHNSPDLKWLRGRFEGIHKAGLLLLYYLQDLPLRRCGNGPPICEDCERALFLRSLPATSLACLLFKLISGVRILRIYGPEPIRETWRKGDAAARSDVELVCKELMLRDGPSFFLALLLPEADVQDTDRAMGRLQTEVENLPSRQSPFYPPTLISILRRALAEKMGIDVRVTMSKMWETLASSGFDDLDGDGRVRMAKVVRGKELSAEEKGMRRIF